MRSWAIAFALIWAGLQPHVAVAQADKHATPQAAFDAACATFVKADWKSHAACYTDEALEANAGALVFLAEFAKAFASPGVDDKQDRLLKDIDAIFAKHGVTKELLKEMPDGGKDAATQRKAFRARGKLLKDKPAFLGEMSTAMKAASGSSVMDKHLGTGNPLKDVVIRGDSADALHKSEQGERPYSFKKVDGGWRIDSSVDFTSKAPE